MTDVTVKTPINAPIIETMVAEILPVIKQQIFDTETAEFTLFIQPSLLWFKGHFPGAPILPGVVQLNWVRQLCTQIWPEHACWLKNVQQLEVIKFQQVIRPEDEVQLSVLLQADRKRVQFTYCLKQENGQKNVATGRLVGVV